MELPDLEITVHSIALESSLVSTARAEKMEVYIDVDLLGLGDEGLLTPRVRPDEGELPLDFHEAIAVEPGEPVWAPLREALRSADEQDSDVYFVLHGASPTAAPRELGSAHLNLERLLALDADADHERLPVVDGDGRRVAMVSVSLKARAALKWCKRGADETKLKLGVRVGAAVLSAAAGARLEGRTALQVEVELPGGLPLKSVKLIACQLFKVEPTKQQLLYNPPGQEKDIPEPLDDDSKTLAEMGVLSGGIIVIDEQ